MPQSCCQASQNHCLVACGPIKKFYDDYNVVFFVSENNAIQLYVCPQEN